MPKRNLKGLRILVADDHELVRQGIKSILSARRNWKVVGEAANGIQAVRMVKSLKPNVLIIDITMPGMDGLEATRQIRRGSSTTKILVLTMHESDQMIRKILVAGALAYVLKSDLASQLAKAVHSVARGQLFLTPRVIQIVLRGFLKTEHIPDGGGRSTPTPREREVIRLLFEGKSNKEVGSTLGIAVRTVETYRANIMQKLGVHSITELIHYALDHELVSVHPTPN